MAHKHWPKDHPFYPHAPTCTLLKKDCDTLWREYMHGHEGIRCVTAVLPGNTTATCTLTYTPEELKKRLSKRVS